MKYRSPIWIFVVTIAVASPAFAQQPTLARLNHDATPDILRPPSVTRTSPTGASERRSIALADSPVSRSAAEALFVHSNLSRARSLAGRAWQRDHGDAEALFVQMEAAGMQADDAAMLDAAIHLCELGRAAPDDPRVRLAAVRVYELAANTPEFRNVIPRVRSLLANSPESLPVLNAALLNAAMDGVPGLDPYSLSRALGVLTDWRIVGPLARHSLLDFDQSLITQADDLAQPSYHNRTVENFQFPDGRITLPDYLPHRGIYYAAAHFASLTPGNWTVSTESGGALEVFIDGQSVLRMVTPAVAHHPSSASFDVLAGPHRVLLKFVGSAAPLRISILPSVPYVPTPARANISLPELTYELAAERYAAGEFGTAIRQIKAVSSARESAALQFLLAQSWTQLSPTGSDGVTAWDSLRSLAPTALAADAALGKMALTDGDFPEAARLERHVLASRPANVVALEILASAQAGDEDADPTAADEEDVWSRRLAVHPSCEGLQGAIRFYRSQGRSTEANAAQQKLEDCAPESTDYARSLSEQGSHAQAAQSLQRLLTAAPLNRAARLMLVRELQMAGDDATARRAAADWLRIAPNAENYHRLATNEAAGTSVGTISEEGSSPTAEFYVPYRRDAIQAARQTAGTQFAAAAVLLDDHIAIARPDGSVSLYVHTVTRLLGEIEQLGDAKVPKGAQVLELRAIHADGTVDPIESDLGGPGNSSVNLSTGDVLDEEYVVHYAGDGGIPEHSEVFQFVFGSFDRQVLSARFVALTPAEHADRGVVIATGEAPHMTAYIRDGMLARVWQKDTSAPAGWTPATLSKPLAIVRVVEQENGWTVPSKAEHQRRIETIHPGPRLEDSSLRVLREELRAHQL